MYAVLLISFYILKTFSFRILQNVINGASKGRYVWNKEKLGGLTLDELNGCANQFDGKLELLRGYIAASEVVNDQFLGLLYPISNTWLQIQKIVDFSAVNLPRRRRRIIRIITRKRERTFPKMMNRNLRNRSPKRKEAKILVMVAGLLCSLILTFKI